MSIFMVTMTHPDGPGWNRHVLEHVEYLLKLIDEGKILASGPLKGTPSRAGCIVMRASSRENVEALVAADPCARENLIIELTVVEWDPLFGALAEASSGEPPPDLRDRQPGPLLIEDADDLPRAEPVLLHRSSPDRPTLATKPGHPR